MKKLIQIETLRSLVPKETVGQGIDTIPVPSNPDQLREQFILQIAAKDAGHRNTFNQTNAIMKEMLRQKLMTPKEYRNVLKHSFHV